MNFLYSFHSEWLKKKHSAAAALVWLGAFLIPVILLIIRLKNFHTLAAANTSAGLWDWLYRLGWQFMATFLLPLGVMLATSLVTQLEYRNNTWKQALTTPQSITTLYFSKLIIIIVMLLQFFLLYNIGLYLAGALPAFFKSIPYPQAAFPFGKYLTGSAWFFVDSLPIIGLQYLVSVQFRNFLLPLGVGIALYVASMVAVQWEYGYTIPYSYSTLEFIKTRRPRPDIHLWAIGYFIFFIATSYILFLTKKDKS